LAVIEVVIWGGQAAAEPQPSVPGGIATSKSDGHGDVELKLERKVVVPQ
jgi:hypothetical protein